MLCLTRYGSNQTGWKEGGGGRLLAQYLEEGGYAWF